MHRACGAILILCALAFPARAQVLPAGSLIHVRLSGDILSDTSRAGQTVEATFTEAVRWQQIVIVPAGARYRGTIDHVEKQTSKDGAWIRLVFTEIQLSDGRRVDAYAANSFRASGRSRTVEHAVAIPAGAGAGAAVAGNNKRIAGMLGGAIAGMLFIHDRRSSGNALHLHSGQTLELRLNANLSTALRASQ